MSADRDGRVPISEVGVVDIIESDPRAARAILALARELARGGADPVNVGEGTVARPSLEVIDGGGGDGP